MTEEIQQHIDVKERATEYHKKVLYGKKLTMVGFLTLGEAFSVIKKERLFKPLGFETFEKYIHSPDVQFERSSVYVLIGIYDTFITRFGFSPKRIQQIGVAKLSLLFHHLRYLPPHQETSSKLPYEEYIDLAGNLTRSQLQRELKKRRPLSKKKERYGPFIDHPIFRHGPTNEQGVVFLFAALCNKLGFEVDYIRTGFPDCKAKRKLENDEWEEVRIEFEFKSKNFSLQRHNADECDLIVCWKDDWKDRPDNIEVLSLEERVRELKQRGKWPQ